MREIKFRAWDKIDEKLWNVISIDFIKGEVTLLNEYTKESYIREIDEVELMQYTGLKDKNGKEIYGGDIVEIISQVTMRYEKGKIIFDCGCYFVNYGWNTHLLFEFLNDIKVVGNIYENQELLEELNNGKR